MSLCKKLCRARWLLAIPLAWATCALIVLGNSGSDGFVEFPGAAHFHAAGRSAGDHWHGQIERHRHAADSDASKIRVDSGSPSTGLGGSKLLTVSVDTLPAAPLVFSPGPGAAAVEGSFVKGAALHFPSALERPPAAS